MYEKYDADKDSWKILFRKMERNHFSRLYGSIRGQSIPSTNRLHEVIEENNEFKEKVFNWEK